MLAVAATLSSASADGPVAAWCQRALSAFGVLIGESWGSLPAELRAHWGRLQCDFTDARARAAHRKRARFASKYAALINAAIDARAPHERIAKVPGSGDPSLDPVARPRPHPHQQQQQQQQQQQPIIAIGAASTTRGMRAPVRLSRLALFSTMLPSLVRVAEAGFEYWLYVAFDVGDGFFEQQRAKANGWIERRVRAPLAARGITLRWALLRFANPMAKPGPAFNFMMGAAYVDGADFLYRVNDDTEFVTAWAHAAVHTLRTAFSPPLLGVVGPLCRQGKTSIMTHDLVHRTHLDVFGLYYPAVFVDWWMDDWISAVYGAARTRQGPWEVRHGDGAVGRRYDVDPALGEHLRGELATGSKVLARWEAANVHCLDIHPIFMRVGFHQCTRTTPLAWPATARVRVVHS